MSCSQVRVFASTKRRDGTVEWALKQPFVDPLKCRSMKTTLHCLAALACAASIAHAAPVPLDHATVETYFSPDGGAGPAAVSVIDGAQRRVWLYFAARRSWRASMPPSSTVSIWSPSRIGDESARGGEIDDIGDARSTQRTGHRIDINALVRER
jgi:hypothetical protein